MNCGPVKSMITASLLAVCVALVSAVPAGAESDLCDSHRIGTTVYRGVPEAFGMDIHLISVTSRKNSGRGVSIATIHTILNRCASAKGWMPGLGQLAKTGLDLGLADSIIGVFKLTARYSQEAVDQECG